MINGKKMHRTLLKIRVKRGILPAMPIPSTLIHNINWFQGLCFFSHLEFFVLDLILLNTLYVRVYICVYVRVYTVCTCVAALIRLNKLAPKSNQLTKLKKNLCTLRGIQTEQIHSTQSNIAEYHRRFITAL